MRCFISIPMNGRPEEVQKELCQIKQDLAKAGITGVDAFTAENPDNHIRNHGIYFLGESLKVMSTCDCVYFAPGWQTARGCTTESLIAYYYGLPVLKRKDGKEFPCIT